MRTVRAIAWWAGWLLLSMVPRLQATETVTLYVTNAQGTVVAEMTPQGQVTYEATYRPYGEQVTGVPLAGPGYTGHVNDPDSGLVYMQARYYDPEVGRFLSMDPMGPSAGNGFNFNRYAYADNSPSVNIDPTGMCSQPGVPDPVCPQPPAQPMQSSPPTTTPPSPSNTPTTLPPVTVTATATATNSESGVPNPNSVPGGPWTPHDKPGQFQGPKPGDGVGGRRRLQYVPPEGEGGPPGSKGYWKVNEPGQKGWQRFDFKGNQITPEQAHPGNRLSPLSPIPPAVDIGPVICFTCQIFIQELKAQQDTNVPSA